MRQETSKSVTVEDKEEAFHVGKLFHNCPP